MKAIHSDQITGTPDEFILEVVRSRAFAGAHPFFYEDSHGQECEMMIFALKCPVDIRKLCDMMHVIVESVDFYEAWKDGQPPSTEELEGLSPDR